MASSEVHAPVRVFDDALEGHTSDGRMVASVFDTNACAILLSVLASHGSARCGACEWCLWDYSDSVEYASASYDEIARLINGRMFDHAHTVHASRR